MLRRWPLILLSLLTACAGLRPTPVPTGGVMGRVWIGPICPVVREGEACPDQPFQTQLVVQDSRGRTVAGGRSDARGFFRIPLPPGDYTLIPELPNPGSPADASSVEFHVEPDAWTEVTLNFDSGIR